MKLINMKCRKFRKIVIHVAYTECKQPNCNGYPHLINQYSNHVEQED